MVICTTVANLLLKSGASQFKAGGLLGLVNWQILLGMLAFGTGAAAYVLVLTRLPLNVANSFAAVQFIAVVIAAAVVLGEPIGWLRWMGIGLIAVGVLLVGRSVPN